MSATEAAEAALADFDTYAINELLTYFEDKLGDALRALLAHTEAVEAERDRLRLIHVGTGKLALSAIFLADVMDDDESVQAVRAEYLRPYIDRAEKAEAALTVIAIECPHWSPGRITLRSGCTACAAEHAEKAEAERDHLEEQTRN